MFNDKEYSLYFQYSRISVSNGREPAMVMSERDFYVKGMHYTIRSAAKKRRRSIIRIKDANRRGNRKFGQGKRRSVHRCAAV